MTKSDEPSDDTPLDLSVLDGIAGGTGETYKNCSNLAEHTLHTWTLSTVTYTCPGVYKSSLGFILE